MIPSSIGLRVYTRLSIRSTGHRHKKGVMRQYCGIWTALNVIKKVKELGSSPRIDDWPGHGELATSA